MTDTTTTDDGVTRQYGAAIAIVSGLYSLLTATAGGGMTGTTAGGVMTLLGIVVVVHGVVLLTPFSRRLGGASGPLMVAYALVMVLNQTLVGVTGGANWGPGMTGGMGSGMTGGMGSGMTGAAGTGMAGGMGWNLGMVALAVLLLVSGVIMTARRGRDDEAGVM